jgi:MFS family permease
MLEEVGEIMAKRALFPGWKVVLGAGVGIAFGSLVIFASGFAILAAAMAPQFGWTQPEVAKAASIFLLVQTLTFPLCGWPLDKWGSRRFAIANILAFAGVLVVLSQIGGSLLQFYLVFALLSLVSAGTNPVSYVRAISLWFKRKRGVALGLAACGQALGAFLVPVLGQKCIAQYGWPTALVFLAAFEALICMPLVATLVKDNPADFGLLPDGDTAQQNPPVRQHDEPSMEFGIILRTATFWKLAAAFGIMGMSFYAITPNIVYILNKMAGMSLAQVAMVQAVSGIAVLFGRIGFGLLLDRVHASLVGVGALALFAGCCLIYATTPVPALVAVGAIIGGLSIGGETDLLPYLASRYFGTRAVSKIYGWFLFAFFLGATVGPFAFAQLMTNYDGAEIPLFMLIALQALPAALFLSLGRYPSVPSAGSPPVPDSVARSA